MLEYVGLFFAAFFAAAISGVAGFGGALLLLPLVAATVGVQKGVPLLTVVQLLGNLSRAGFGFKQIKWKPVGLFLLGGVPFCILGAFSFVELPKEIVTRVIGAIILLAVALQYFGEFKFKAGPKVLIAGGAVVGLISGMVGSSGPISAAIFLTLKLKPVAYIASDATTSLVMHALKTAVYQHYIDFDREFWILAAVMGIAVIAGTWVGKKIVENMPQKKFQWLVGILLVLNALYMLIHG